MTIEEKYFADLEKQIEKEEAEQARKDAQFQAKLKRSSDTYRAKWSERTYSAVEKEADKITKSFEDIDYDFTINPTKENERTWDKVHAQYVIIKQILDYKRRNNIWN